MKKTYLGINIDTDKDKLLSEQAEKLLKDYYCKEEKIHYRWFNQVIRYIVMVI